MIVNPKNPLITSSLAPLLVPYCGRCDMPAERLRFNPALDPWGWTFEVTCCGTTRGARLPIEDILRIQTTGEKFYAIPKKAHAQTIKPQARLARPTAPRIYTR